MEYVTFPGTATPLDAGDPPGNVHAYEAMLPFTSGSLPLPEKATTPPGSTVTFDAGLSIDAVGAWLGGADTVIVLVERSCDAGFFDLHWLEKCPLLDVMRADPRYPALHAKVKARAEAILDALYGDQGGVATQDTALATT